MYVWINSFLCVCVCVCVWWKMFCVIFLHLYTTNCSRLYWTYIWLHWFWNTFIEWSHLNQTTNKTCQKHTIFCYIFLSHSFIFVLANICVYDHCLTERGTPETCMDVPQYSIFRVPTVRNFIFRLPTLKWLGK